MKIIQNTLNYRKKISNVSKKIWVGPKKVGLLGFRETRHFLLPDIHVYSMKMNLWPCVVCLSWQITSPGAVVGVKRAPSS